MAAEGAEEALRGPGGPGLGVDASRVQRHVTVLMAARLALAIAGLAIALGLESLGAGVTLSEWSGFYGVLAVVFVATLIYWPLAGRVRRMRPFVLANLGLDLGLVTALVLFSGGSESVFTFLYMVVPVYTAVLLSGRGAILCAGAAGLTYAAVLLAEHLGVLGLGSGVPDAVLAMRWLVHTGALLLVATLAGFMVSELARADEALVQRTSDLVALRTLHQRTVESLMSGLLTTDREGRITSFNREAERITGLSRDEANQRLAIEVLPGVEALAFEDRTDASVRSRIPFDGPDGERLYLGVGTHVLRDADGQSEGRVVIFQDLSDVVEMEQQLRRSERLAAVGQLSASIAHEIRNPLAAISGAIQMLEAGKETGQDPERLMNIVLREVDRLNHLITDFLEYARPSPLESEPVDLASLIEEVAGIVRMSHEGRIEVEVSVEPGLVATVDPRKVRQVVWNLLLNASEALPEGGRLAIEARSRPGDAAQGAEPGDRMEAEDKAAWAEIAVMDDGSGIDPELAERIFDPFFTTKAGGSGLGLPTVHRIVEEHGGTMRLERGQGGWSTVFRVLLPKHGAVR